jgi:hypothetical protein
MGRPRHGRWGRQLEDDVEGLRKEVEDLRKHVDQRFGEIKVFLFLFRRNVEIAWDTGFRDMSAWFLHHRQVVHTL